MNDLTGSASTPDDQFSREVAGLAPASPLELVALGHGERFALGIGPVAKRIGEDVVRMLAYGGSIPGPVLHVNQGSEIVVDVTNEGDTEATVHWHGLRLERMLRRGFTTVRDAGGLDAGVQEALRAGLVSGPRVFRSGRSITSSSFAHVADGVDAVCRAAREQLKAVPTRSRSWPGAG